MKNRIVTWIKDWAETAECFAWVIAATSVIYGSALAWHEGYHRWGLFALTLIAGVLMQCGVNLCNVYDGWTKGQDQQKDTFGDIDNPLVQGRIKLEHVRNGAIGAFTVASLIGFYLAYVCGWPILVFGLIGLIGGRSYTGGPLSYKEAGLGPIIVLFLMGHLMILPSYFIQSGHFAWWVVLAATPVSMLISMVMQANDIRDVEDDIKTGVRSMATRLGRRGALGLYAGMWIGAYAIQGLCVSQGYLPYTSALTVLLWPQLFKMAKTYSDPQVSRENIVALEKMSAQLHLKYGLLNIIALLLPW